MMSSRARPSCLPQPQSYPWLLYHYGKDYTHKTFQTIGEHQQQHCRRCTIPELRRKKVVASFPGWLLLYQIDNHRIIGETNYHYFTLWNPTTFESIDAPPLKLSGNHKIECYVLMSDGNGEDGSRKVPTLLLFESTMPCIFLYRHYIIKDLGGYWRSFRYGKESKAYYNQHNEYKIDYARQLKQPVCCDGKLYALTHNQTKLVEIQINIDNDDHGYEKNANNNVNPCLVIRFLGCDMPKPTYRSMCSSMDLVESQGKLFWIVIEFGGINCGDLIAINVFKLNFSTWNWVELDGLEDNVFFLCLCGRSQGFSLKAQERLGGNRIYFIRPNEKHLYSYNMDDNTVSVSLPCTNLPTPWRPPIWVMPDVVNREGDKLDMAQQNQSLVSEFEQLQTRNNSVQETLIEVCDLSFDVLKLIAEKLFLFDYMNFREVCRVFQSVAPPIHWRTVLTRPEMTTPGCLSRAWLILLGNKKPKTTWSFVDPHTKSKGRKYLITTPQQLEDVTIQCSKDGWLLLSYSKDQTELVFFNPFTKAMIQLPRLDTMDDLQIGYAFSSSPTSTDCIIVSISWVPGVAHINIFSSGMGMDDWDCIEFENNLSFKSNWGNPVFWNGAFYFLGHDGNLGVLQIHGEGSYDWKVLDRPKRPSKSFHQNFLVECGGDLLSVFIGYMGRTVEVFKLNLSKLVWEKLNSLGGYVLFISRSTSYSTLAESQEMENTIFFPRFHEESLVYYSLDTGKFHSVGSDDSFIDYNGTREQLLCGWIEPRWC